MRAMPVRPPNVMSSTSFPCGQFDNVAITCESDLGEHHYAIDFRIFCDEAGAPLRIDTAPSASTPEMFQLGARCVIDTDVWTIDDANDVASIDCTDDWNDGTTSRYQFELAFSSNTAPIHGIINFLLTYNNPGHPDTMGYSNCTF